MDSPEWRSFASHEMTQLGSDLDSDLVAQPGQDSTANRLLVRDGQEQHIDEPTRVSASVHRTHTNSSFVYSDDGGTYPLPPDETANQHSVQTGAGSVQYAEKVYEPVYWNGNAWYALTWEFLGIVVSICFLGKSNVQYIRSLANMYVVLGAFVVHLKDQQESAWSIQVIQATRIAPSLWPILFSGVLGNAIRALADWRVERGVGLLVCNELPIVHDLANR
jgi:hypothetical protein